MKSYFALTAAVLLCGYAIRQVRARGMDRWIIPYLARGRRPRSGPRGPIHVLICIADHFEPRVGGASADVALRTGRDDGCATIPRSSAVSATATGGRPATRSSSRSRSTIPSISTPWPDSAGPASARLRSTCTTTTTRPRTSGGPCWQPSELFARRHGLLSRDRRTGRLGLRLHPRQLGPGQLATRRPLVRRQQRARCPARDRMLRRFHLPLGPQPDPAAQDQQHLLRGRRPRPAPVA